MLIDLAIIFMWLIYIILNVMYNRKVSYPPTILGILWGTTIIISILIYRNMYSWNYYGLFYIFIAITMYTIFCAIGAQYKKNKHPNPKLEVTGEIRKSFNTNLPYITLNIFTILGTIYPLLTIFKNGYDFTLFFDVDLLLSMNKEMALGRYTDAETYYNPLVQILLVFGYAAPLIGGYTIVYTDKGRIKKIYAYASFLPAILSLITTNGKTGLIFSIVLWTSSYFVARQEKYKRLPRINIKVITRLLKLSIVPIILLYGSFFLRYGGFAIEKISRINERMIMYAFGHIPSFDNIFSNADIADRYTLGYRTFEGVFRMFSSAKRVSIPNPWLELEIGGTNVGTLFTGLLSDFGLIGSILFMCIFGFISGIAYRNVTFTEKAKNINLILLTASYSLIFYSFLVSLFTYVSILMAFVAFYFFLIVIRRYEFN